MKSLNRAIAGSANSWRSTTTLGAHASRPRNQGMNRLTAVLLSTIMVMGGLLATASPASADDTPGCVTRSEFYRVHYGQTMRYVHRTWGTSGYLRIRQGNGQNRGYRICGVRGTNVFAEFALRRDHRWHLTWKKANAQ